MFDNLSMSNIISIKAMVVLLYESITNGRGVILIRFASFTLKALHFVFRLKTNSAIPQTCSAHQLYYTIMLH